MNLDWIDQVHEAVTRGVIHGYGPRTDKCARCNWMADDYLVAADKLEDAYLPLAAEHFRKIGLSYKGIADETY
jgi:hypothetical protein